MSWWLGGKISVLEVFLLGSYRTGAERNGDIFWYSGIISDNVLWLADCMDGLITLPV